MGKSSNNKAKVNTTKNNNGPGTKKNTKHDSVVSTPTTNKPRNLLITDATTPLEYEWMSDGQRHEVIVYQTADDETWPGGAVWDLGWCMGQLLISMIHGTVTSVTTTTDANDPTKRRSVSRTLTCPERLQQATVITAPLLSSLKHCSTILELGCGVGLTGMIVTKALGPTARHCILTDLDVVIKNVTQRNVESNEFIACVEATPLCWGDRSDEIIVQTAFRSNSSNMNAKSKGTGRPKKRKGKETAATSSAVDAINSSKDAQLVDLILIGDVAYQHKPGAPSHFDILVSTLLQFTSPNTIVVFGTRIRMPASIDLLDMLHVHFDETVVPPVSATEIDFHVFGDGGNNKHNMSVHFLQRKKE